MHKLFISAFLSGFVLLAGLTSCSPEKKEIDVYRAARPVIRTGRGAQDLKTWEELKNKELDLRSEMDFSESRPARLVIRSSCRTGSDSFRGEGRFTGVARVEIWQTLPHEVLTREIKNLDCSFELDLYNEIGSNHVYTVAPVAIVEKLSPSATIGYDGNAPLAQTLIPGGMRDVRVRFANHSPAAAQMICRDIETSILPFEQVTDLAHFDFAKAKRLTREPAPRVMPVQICRALISENGAPAGLSNRVRVAVPRPALEIQEMPRPRLEFPQLEKVLTASKSGAVFPVTSFKIVNSDSIPRKIRLIQGPRMALSVLISGDTPNVPTKLRRFECMDRVLHYSIDEDAGEAHSFTHPDAQTTVANLHPGEAVVVQVNYKAPGTFNDTVLGLQIASQEGQEIEELADDGTVVSSLTLAPQIYSALKILPNMIERVPGTRRCNWLR